MRAINKAVPWLTCAFVITFFCGCHFGEERLKIPTGVRVLPDEIPSSVMDSEDVEALPKDVRIERFGDDSNGLWRFIYPDGTVKHKDQSGKDVVVHGGII